MRRRDDLSGSRQGRTQLHTARGLDRARSQEIGCVVAIECFDREVERNIFRFLRRGAVAQKL